MYMIQHTKKISLLIIILLFNLSCRDKVNNEDKFENINEDQISKVEQIDSSLKNAVAPIKNKIINNWVFNKVVSLSDSYTCNNIDKYQKFRFNISNDSVYIENEYTDDVFSGEIKSEILLKKHGVSKEFILKEFNLNTPQTIKYVRNKKANQSDLSKLDSFFEDAFYIDENILFEKDGCVYCYKKNRNNILISKNSSDCYSKTKITNLPITKDILNGNNVWNQLDCNIEGIDTKDYLRLPDANGIMVLIIGNFNFDDYTYTLVTLNDSKVITKKDIGFAEGGGDGNTVIKFTEFEISKDYVFNLNTKTRKGDDFKTIKQEKFKIDENGLVVVIK
jgi:hypothetical protein